MILDIRQKLRALLKSFIPEKIQKHLMLIVPKKIHMWIDTFIPKGLSESEFLTPNNARVGLIGTMPRSGTWYHHYFFYFYDLFLQGFSAAQILEKAKISPPNLTPIQNYGNSFGVDIFLVAHMICPGFENYNGKYRKDWQSLRFYVDGFNYGSNVIKNHMTVFDPEQNPNARVVYVYRNPLDQAVSFYNHSMHHKESKHRYFLDQQESSIRIDSVKKYILQVGIDAYIKQFITYQIMGKLYPEQILLLSYEGLMRDPKSHFKSILSHFGNDTESLMHQTAFTEALKLSDRNSMKNFENSLGRSLGNDQTNTNERHIRDGKIGKWKEHLGEEDLSKIEKRLNKFDLTLSQFEKNGAIVEID